MSVNHLDVLMPDVFLRDQRMLELIHRRSDHRGVGAALISVQRGHPQMINNVRYRRSTTDAARMPEIYTRFKSSPCFSNSRASFATQIGSIEPEIAP
jgi:hypothetical protein